MTDADQVDNARLRLEAAIQAYNMDAWGGNAAIIRLRAAIRVARSMAHWEGKHGGVIGRPGLNPDNNLREAITEYTHTERHAISIVKGRLTGARLPGI